MEKNKDHINLAIIGDVDSGKSTFSGHFVYKLGKEKEKIQQIIKQTAEGENSKFKYAWVMDTLKSERQRKHTIDISSRQFETPKHRFTIIDTPGHRDFLKNMITGTSQADCTILIVSANQQEFSRGFSSQSGQTKQHALLAYTFGIKQMIIGINKMDQVNYAQQRFQAVKIEISKYLTQVGFNLNNISFVPIAALLGENLFQKSQKLEWYKGKTILEILDQIQSPKKLIDKPLRIPIQNVFSISGFGTIPVGKVQFGIIKTKMIVSFSPGGYSSEVKSLQTHNQHIQQGIPGDFVGFCVADYNDGSIRRGHVAGDLNNDPPKQVQSFLAQIIIINHPKIIQVGYTPMVDCHTSHVACRFDRFLSKIDRKTGKIIQQNPKSLKSGDCAMVVLKPIKSMSCQPINDYPGLGRFSVRDLNHTVAVGVIKKCQKKNLNK